MASIKDRRKPSTQATKAAAPSKTETLDRAGEGFEAYIQHARRQNTMAATIGERLRALGLEGITTRKEFKRAAQDTNPSTEDGAKRLAEIMALAEDFASLTPPVDDAPAPTSKPIRAHSVVDNNEELPNDATMTDLTRQEVDAKIAASEAKIDARLANFDASIKTGFADVRVGFAEMRTEMAKLQTEMHKNTSDLIKWGLGIAIAIIGATVGLLTYINKASHHSVPVIQPSAVSSSQPVVPQPTPPAPALK
jgi:hypothetical protein